jgi:nicotinamidase-related amidase
MRPQVNGIYPWPYDGIWKLSKTALVIVDMQQDYLSPQGWFAATGGDTSAFCQLVPQLQKLLRSARKAALPSIFTVEAHRADLSDVPQNKIWRMRRLGRAIGEEGPLGRALISGEAGSTVISGLSPRAGEPVVEKPGKSAFIASDFDQLLRRRGIRNLVFAGITTDGAVQCTLRDANDRGYECLLLSNATASDVLRDHEDQIHTLSLAGGHYGSIATAEQFLAAIEGEA